jgi:hypothetical protein
MSLSDSGLERWVYRYNGPADGDDWAYSVAAGLDGNLYAAGWSRGIGTMSDFTVVSLSDSGVERWVYRNDGPGSDWDFALSIAAGPDGDLYVAGGIEDTMPGSDFAVVSLSDSGVENWIYKYNGPGNSSDEAHSIIVGSDGNIYAAGLSEGIGTNYDFTVVSLSDLGVERWVYRYNGPGNNWDWAQSITMGLDGNVYAAGFSEGSGTSRDFIVVSLTESGAERWVYRYDGPASSSDEATSIAAGLDGNIYAAGSSIGNGTSDDFTVLSLTSSVGADAAVIELDSPPDTVFVDSTYSVGATVINFGSLMSSFDVVASVDGYVDTVQVQDLGPGSQTQVSFLDWQVPSPDSTVYGMTVCVYAAGDVDTTNDCMQKSIFAYNPPGIEESIHRSSISDLAVWQNSPNPFQRTTQISYCLPTPTRVTLSIIDIAGRLVETLVNETQQPGIHQIHWNRKTNPSGVYFYSLRAGDFLETRKMVLLD